MYEEFYRLRESPFALTPDPAYLHLTSQHNLALSMLRYGVMSRSGFCLLTGEVGSGKTLLVRRLLESLPQDVTVGLINNLTRDCDDLLQWISMSFGLAHAGKDVVVLYQEFVEFLLREYAAGRRVLLIVDEAQNLATEMLEQLRVLSNVNSGKHLLLQTFLVGQPELLETLRQPALRQFAQRITIEYHLGPLGLEDALAYVRHRVAVAGRNDELFSVGAIALVHQVTGGVPRLINQLCDTALVYGFAEQQPGIDAGLMTQVIASRKAGGIFPEMNAAAGAGDTARIRFDPRQVSAVQ